MEKISEGPELDQAVAEAIGLVCTHRVLGSNIIFWSDPQAALDAPRTFEPSTNLNNAFRAAEAVGLFNDNHRVLRKDTSDETWEIADVFFNRETIVASEGTPALAICAAVLKNSEEALKQK